MWRCIEKHDQQHNNKHAHASTRKRTNTSCVHANICNEQATVQMYVTSTKTYAEFFTFTFHLYIKKYTTVPTAVAKPRSRCVWKDLRKENTRTANITNTQHM